MTRLQWKLFFSFGGGLALFGCLAGIRPAFFPVAALSFAGLLLSTVGGMALRGVRNMITRRRGVPAVGRVIHARQSGYTNNVPTWEIEVELPQGTRARLLVTRWDAFVPGEAIHLLVDPRSPTHAVLPPAASHDF